MQLQGAIINNLMLVQLVAAPVVVSNNSKGKILLLEKYKGG
jgi:hypothetical protein